MLRKPVPAAAPQPEAEPPAPAPVEVKCLCGGVCSVLPDDDETRHQCPHCRRKFQVVVQEDPESGGTVAFPMFVEEDSVSGDTQIAIAVKPPVSKSAAELPPPPKRTPVVCACGKTLLVGPEVHGKVIKCKTCGARLAIRTKTGPDGTVIVAPERMRSETVQAPKFVQIACLCGGPIELEWRAGARATCESCGKKASLFFEGDEPSPMFVE